MVLRNTQFLERERQEYAQSTKQQEKERKELLDRKRRKPISIQVQILTGRKIPLLVDPQYDVLLDIKKKIQIKEGIHPDQQILLLNGIRLQEEGHRSLRDLYIEEGACLFLTLRNRGG